MIHRIGGVYPAPITGVDRIGGREVPATPASPGRPAGPADLLARDAIKVASISDLASRSSTLHTAIRNLDDIQGYLDEMI